MAIELKFTGGTVEEVSKQVLTFAFTIAPNLRGMSAPVGVSGQTPAVAETVVEEVTEPAKAAQVKAMLDKAAKADKAKKSAKPEFVPETELPQEAQDAKETIIDVPVETVAEVVETFEETVSTEAEPETTAEPAFDMTEDQLRAYMIQNWLHVVHKGDQGAQSASFKAMLADFNALNLRELCAARPEDMPRLKAAVDAKIAAFNASAA